MKKCANYEYIYVHKIPQQVIPQNTEYFNEIEYPQPRSSNATPKDFTLFQTIYENSFCKKRKNLLAAEQRSKFTVKPPIFSKSSEHFQTTYQRTFCNSNTQKTSISVLGPEQFFDNSLAVSGSHLTFASWTPCVPRHHLDLLKYTLTRLRDPVGGAVPKRKLA